MRKKILSVFENLLSNALRYATSVIKISVVDRSKDVVIRVIDDGVGFKEDEEALVFERFYKGEKGHSGIGLAIVKEIINGHGGTIRAGNHISGGAVFEITLPKEG